MEHLHHINGYGEHVIDLSQEEKVQKIPSSDDVIDLTHESHFVPRKRRRRHGEIVCIEAARPSNEMFDCLICLEKRERFRGQSLTRCGHLFCSECLHEYIRGRVVGEKSCKIACPSTACQLQLSTVDIRACTLELGDCNVWKLYQEVATTKFLDQKVAASSESSSGMRRCPTNECNFVFSFEPSGEGQLFICPECDKAYCLNCPVVGGKVGPAHNDSCAVVLEEVRKCEERKRMLREWEKENSQANERFQELLRREGASGRTKKCPRCKSAITKNGGCDHMHCSSCGLDFSWSQAIGGP